MQKRYSRVGVYVCVAFTVCVCVCVYVCVCVCVCVYKRCVHLLGLLSQGTITVAACTPKLTASWRLEGQGVGRGWLLLAPE
jgi:hypothetical protein